mmetsp:Transcript_21342/g.31025  ORF Transcript_21342/g.31025 Transcript_21342/m.31025 type:complete len:934 (-) Transcript_21342:142-2943(-)|eukprot:CAMPEP_0184739038 /NCGR_PEP_ID=MMETSP0315-20130426/1825_1 /TAXON_ID=101924 /ORGANISM="Rhodosorus marinus, Strain UTEX LB 2760" /LENGTH=933 /DNA_ID=CAMNT_0027207395 /DNA_START=88 /DNA_END=2889 /DNA_ORIENTATION=-
MTAKLADLLWWIIALCAIIGFSADAAPMPCRHGSSSRAPKLIPSTRQVDCEGIGVLPDNVQLKNIPGIEENCVKVGDLLELPGNFAEMAVKDAESSSSAVDLLNNIVDPLETALKVALQSVTGRVNDNICFGNFKGSEFKAEINIDQDPMHFNKCKELPVLKDAEWSAFAFAVTAPFPGCFSTTGTLAFCAAVSICPETKLPSVAVVINAETLECMGENLGAASAGITAVAGKVISLGLDFLSWGISLSNSLSANVNIYTGHADRNFKFVGYEVRGNYQDSIRLKLKLEKFKVPPVLGITGDHKRIVSVRGIENVQFENLISSFTPDDDGDILDVFESLQDVTIQGAIIIKLQLNFKFSEVKALRKVLPDSGAITVGEANLFFTTGSATPPGEEYAGLVVKPGVYGLVGSNAVPAIIKTLLEYALSFVGSILDLFPDWVPIKFDAKDMIDGINLDVGASDTLGFGFTANTEQTAFVINAPLIFDFLGFITIECKTDYSSLKCKVDTEFNTKFFSAVAETIAEGVLWVINETDELFTDLGNVVGAAFEDAVDGVVSAFSEDNIKATAKLVEQGLLSVGDDIADELKSWARWADTVFDDFADIMSDLTSDAINEIAEFGNGLVNDAEQTFNDAGDDLKSAAEHIANTFTCNGDSVIDAITGCKNCCVPMSEAVAALLDAGNNIEKAFDTVIKLVSNIATAIGDVFFATRTSFTYEDVRPPKLDEFNCLRQHVIKITKKYVFGIKVSEKRKKVGQTSREDCLKTRLVEARDVVAKFNVTADAETNYLNTFKANRDAVFGAKLTKQEILDSGELVCSRDIRRDQVEAGKLTIPVTVSCSAKSIGDDGTFSGPVVTVSRTKEINMSSTKTRGDMIDQLWNDVKRILANKMTPTMTRDLIIIHHGDFLPFNPIPLPADQAQQKNSKPFKGQSFAKPVRP